MQALIKKSIPDFLKESRIFNVNATDMQGNFIYVNDLFAKRFSFITKNFIGFPSLKTVYPADHNACYKAVEACLTPPFKPVKVQLRKPLKDTKEVEWTDWEFSVLFNDDNEPFGVLCVGYAITHLKQSLKKLQLQNEQITKIAQQQAHQIRGPISTLLMALEVFKMKGKHSDESKISLLHQAAHQTDDSIKQIVEEYIDNIRKANVE